MQKDFDSIALAGPSPGSPWDFIVNVGDRLFFAFDRSDIDPSAAEILKRMAQWLCQYSSYQFVIEGHTDDRGTREYNIGLGVKRAASCKQFLVGNGVNPTRIRTISYGAERPAMSGEDEEAWRQNRRCVVVLQ